MNVFEIPKYQLHFFSLFFVVCKNFKLNKSQNVINKARLTPFILSR